MKIIGLTGGIASGKSTVARTLRELGATVIDADEIAHSVIEPGKPAWEDIVKKFGSHILKPDQTIDREKLGAIVFNDPELLQELNQITHPRVAEQLKHIITTMRIEQSHAILFLEVPLLYETHLERICDEVWVVWVDEETQIQRLMKRDNLSREDAIKRIDAQMSLDEKARRADVVIDNRSSLEETIAKATKYYNEILSRT
ncbi:MAG TPA: dephospho-CoA kinase [Syntrophomonadaceae bacterium]|nr:dephospho-CoA kinase [Syntrophomonadaceae bacterium]HOQ08988.1 dephospho-CoA kinase [Syntrophomonadaceae bacterium]HPU47911.1 dephospho-CoA kinase [Syntrophomonadaceae bacterium]